MADQAPASTPTTPAPPPRRGWLGGWFALREAAPRWQVVLIALLCVLVCFTLWWYVTRGEPEERIIPPGKGLQSPKEVWDSVYPSLWVERELTRNVVVTLRRLALGFGLAVLIGVPLGVLCGCYPRIDAFFLPLTIFGRNIPIAALIPLTFAFFGIRETQKVMFIFIACVAFVVWDTARAIADVGSQYVDTAYTLGAKRSHVILKVLVPLAMPSVFNSLRLLFGLAFGYIMLAETIKLGDEAGGLGDIIITSQKRGPREHIIVVLLLIPILALAIDRILFWIQRELFPHRYGGIGILNKALRALQHMFESAKFLFFKPTEPPGAVAKGSP